MYMVINACKPGFRYNQIGEIIQDYAQSHGYYVN